MALAVLDRDDAAGGEALAVADAVDLIDDRHLGIAAEQEIGVQRMRRPCATSSTVRQAATSAWPITWPPNTRCQPTCGLAAAKQIHLERFEVEDREQVFESRWTWELAVMARSIIGGISGGIAMAERIRSRRCYIGEEQFEVPLDARPETCRCADRRRRLRRPRAGDRVAAGTRAIVLRRRCRSGARRARRPMRVRRPSWPRHGGCSRPSASGSG